MKFTIILSDSGDLKMETLETFTTYCSTQHLWHLLLGSIFPSSHCIRKHRNRTGRTSSHCSLVLGCRNPRCSVPVKPELSPPPQSTMEDSLVQKPIICSWGKKQESLSLFKFSFQGIFLFLFFSYVNKIATCEKYVSCNWIHSNQSHFDFTHL